ncbi:DNA-binding transcriptional regulator, LysR family [Roseovarius nanhaiticus]|uniref:DNA-binding transcriptional regulator, LysR family n=1 Tax=Roseovarius nanhaiticus TaxID=573024 RepID=A0A1N7GG42_9RHOB|nr:LysR substrate-binding domain-containing protein [Roseovarius nanhaiticus]SEK27001.1 DNA-binding transcriptional regulator, LysR family [Roseovarius nanhaiticus]SIS11563.1 DNA-binding transcriptional regulator, LysR family [Roseovarius nanhaiticus]
MALPRRFLPSIASLRALEALERLGSATAAAEALSLTQSAVSRQIQALEEQLGVPLVVKSGRRMGLTPDAVQYAAEIRAALGQIAQASMKLAVNPSGGALSLAILPTFGMRWLVPRLPDFARLHPEVTLNLSTRIKPFNFDVEPFDAAIHFGANDWPGTASMRLRGEAVIAVCAPEVIAAKRPANARDLLELPLLHIETRPDAWRAWFAAQGVQAARVPGTIYDQFSTITQAALHGLGVALLPEYLAHADLDSGRLVVAWGGQTASPGGYYLIWPETKGEDGALAKFRDWLSGQINEEDLLPR